MNITSMVPPALLQAFEKIPDLYLILSPDLTILTASDAYLAAIHTTRETIVGRPLFDVFPDNPSNPGAKSVANLQESLQKVMRTGKTHRMALQPYSVPDPAHKGEFVKKYWLPLNTPVLDENGNVAYIIHRVEDQTSLRQKEALLLEEQMHLKDAQALGKIGSFERLLPGNTIVCSDELYRLHGLEPQSEEMTVERFLGFVHPDDYQKIVVAIARAHTTGEPMSVTHRIITAQKELRYIQRRAQILKDQHGKPYKVYGTLQDITEQVAAQQQLKDNQELLRATLDSTQDMIEVFEAVRDSEGQLTDFKWTLSNHAAEKLHGKVTGKQLLQTIPGLQAAGTFARFTQVLETGIPQQYEKEYKLEKLHGFYHQSVVKLGDGVATTTTNITARKMAQLELLKAKEELAQRATDKYLGLFNNMNQGFCIIEVLFNDQEEPYDCRFLEINPMFEKQTGLVNAAGKTVLELGANLEANWYQLYGSVARTGKPIQFENRAADLVGGTWYEVSAFRVGRPEDRQVAVLFNDVTERKKAEQQLRDFNILLEQQVQERTNALEENRQLLNTVLENTSSSMLALTTIRNSNGTITDFEYLYTNSNALQTIAQDSLVGKRFSQLHPEVLPPHLMPHFIEVVTNNTSWQSEVSTQLNGKTVWTQVYATKVSDGLLLTYLDITERKKAEQELHEAQLLTEQVMAATPDFIMVFSLVANKIEYVNRGAYKGNLSRYHETLQLDYDHILSRAHPQDRDKLRAFVDNFRTAPDNEIITVEYRVVDGNNLVWYRSRGKVFKRDTNGNPTHYISVVQDISTVKQLEQENLQIKLNQQKSTIIAILEAQEEERRRISESLHNGVGQLLYAAKLNLDRLQPSSQTENALKQTKDLLSEAINQTRKASHELVPVLLDEFGLDRALHDLCTMYDQSTLYISCNTEGIENRLEPYIEIAVYRICQELINNIVKHAHATAATLQVRNYQNSVVLQVRDNGRGFTQNNGTTKGIGLKTIEDRVKLLNGTFTISPPKTGKGTLVTIELPLR